MDYVALGNRIAKRRRSLGLTQERLADIINKSTSFVGHIERGTRKASLETLVNIANSLDCGVNALLLDSLKREPLLLQDKLAYIRRLIDELNVDSTGN